MIDDLLNHFRSAVPLPDDATAQRVYTRAIRGRRPLPRRRLTLALAAATICVTVPAIVFTEGGGGGSDKTRIGGSRESGVGRILTRYQSEQFMGSHHAISSIAVTIWSRTANATLRVQVIRSDASQVPPPDLAASQIVFQEQVPMSDLASALPDGTLSTWSGTLSPSDWDGGCQDALYRIATTVSSVGSGKAAESGYTAWFHCSGPTLDPTHPFPN